MEKEQIQNKSILGLTSEEYDTSASQYSKSAIFLWCASGMVYIWLSSDHRLLSLVTLLLFIPGIFVASFASAPFFFTSTKLKTRIARLLPHPAPTAFFVLAGTTVLFIAFTVVQIVLPIFFVKLCARIF